MIQQNNINQKDLEIQTLKQKIDTTIKEHEIKLKMIQQKTINEKDLEIQTIKQRIDIITKEHEITLKKIQHDNLAFKENTLKEMDKMSQTIKQQSAKIDLLTKAKEKVAVLEKNIQNNIKK
jgi:hypothetical protein